ncbi:hypothetical protein GQX74_011622 [Glossina fuscipes]|nr:hypothetical protein GQX74_011622 [Glossina fuscipes]
MQPLLHTLDLQLSNDFPVSPLPDMVDPQEVEITSCSGTTVRKRDDILNFSTALRVRLNAMTHSPDEQKFFTWDNAVRQINREPKQSNDVAVRDMSMQLTAPINELKSVVNKSNDSIKKVEHHLASTVSTLETEVNALYVEQIEYHNIRFA